MSARLQLNKIRHLDKTQWQRVAVYGLMALIVCSLVPALKAPHNVSALAVPLTHSPAFARKARDLGAFNWQSVHVETGVYRNSFELTKL